jgi:hypothetical protein
MSVRLRRVVAAAALAVIPVIGSAMPAEAATARNGICEAGEICLYYLTNRTGSVSDFSGSIANYGATQPTCYEFRGSGFGQGQCVKNNAESVWNRSSHSIRVYFNSNYGGASQLFASGQAANLNSTLFDNNASHKVL